MDINKFYKENGYFFPLNVLSKNVALGSAKKIENLYINTPVNLKHPWNLQSHLLAKWIYQITINKNILDAVEKIIGPNILIQSADIFVKPPHGSKFINWHQDANYWGLDPFELVTGWIALTDVFLDNGCMQYLPKSHLNQKINHIETFDKNSDLTRGQEIDLNINKKKELHIELKSGQMSLHHCLLAHGSGPNLTNGYRIGMAIRYLPTYVKQTSGPPISMILARGEDKFNHFIKDTIPTGNFRVSEIETHAKAMLPHAPSNYATS
tara:strand:+ start:32 stop:829 length:798 start_codon:yes stop_codon:yes gene_type:complete